MAISTDHYRITERNNGSTPLVRSLKPLTYGLIALLKLSACCIAESIMIIQGIGYGKKHNATCRTYQLPRKKERAMIDNTGILKSTADAAASLGVSERTVRRWCAYLGFPKVGRNYILTGQLITQLKHIRSSNRRRTTAPGH
jgi:hypothetical protein